MFDAPCMNVDCHHIEFLFAADQGAGGDIGDVEALAHVVSQNGRGACVFKRIPIGAHRLSEAVGGYSTDRRAIAAQARGLSLVGGYADRSLDIIAAQGRVAARYCRLAQEIHLGTGIT